MDENSVLSLTHDEFELQIGFCDPYSPNSWEVSHYDLTYRLGDQSQRYSSVHSVITITDAQVQQSCIVYATGGATGVHEHSAIVHKDQLILAVGPFLCCLGIPSLELCWYQEVDAATCFGVYYSANRNCFISHGELEITRVELDGEIKWKSGGADILTNGFELFKEHVEVVDWNNWRYFIDLDTGQSHVIQ